MRPNFFKVIDMLDSLYKPLSRKGEVFYGLASTLRVVSDYQINLEPDFQRKNVWTLQQKMSFVGHLLEGGDVNPVIINARDDGGYDMVDGKQRVTSCLNFMAGMSAKLSDGTNICVDQLNKRDITMIRTQIGLRYALVDLSRKEMLEYYLKFNRGGTPHTNEELDFVQKLLEYEQKEGLCT